MSNLKHLTLPELLKEARLNQRSLNYHAGKASGLKERQKWIEKYIADRQREIVGLENVQYREENLTTDYNNLKGT